MRRAVWIVPLVGIFVAMSVPLTRYALARRDEQVAAGVLQRVADAQQLFHQQTGGYATDVDSLVLACGAGPAVLDPTLVPRLTGAGYGLQIRAAAGAPSLAGAQDCRGRRLAGDYYAAVAPLDPSGLAQQAFARRADGGMYLSYDGVAPTESDIAAGLATALAERGTFKIP